MSTLPPGQKDYGIFPRFGISATAPIPPVSEPALLRISGAVASSLELPLARLRALPRRAPVAGLHCVTGWSAPGHRWGGVGFRQLYESVIVPEARPATGITHVRLVGADRYLAVLTLEDALDEEVLLADELDGAPLDGKHGAPLRLLSPKQYGYKSLKHLVAIELHTSEPASGHASWFERFLLSLVSPHPRGRVAFEERHRYLPNWMIRALYRSMIPRRRPAPQVAR